MAYYYLQYDYETPKQLTEKSWCFETIRTVDNRFDSEEEARNWCSLLNHNFMSRTPWHIRHSEDRSYDKYVF